MAHCWTSNFPPNAEERGLHAAVEVEPSRGALGCPAATRTVDVAGAVGAVGDVAPPLSAIALGAAKLQGQRKVDEEYFVQDALHGKNRAVVVWMGRSKWAICCLGSSDSGAQLEWQRKKRR